MQSGQKARGLVDSSGKENEYFFQRFVSDVHGIAVQNGVGAEWPVFIFNIPRYSAVKNAAPRAFTPQAQHIKMCESLLKKCVRLTFLE